MKRVQWAYAWSKSRLAPTQSAAVRTTAKTTLSAVSAMFARPDVVQEEGGEGDEDEEPEHVADGEPARAAAPRRPRSGWARLGAAGARGRSVFFDGHAPPPDRMLARQYVDERDGAGDPRTRSPAPRASSRRPLGVSGSARPRRFDVRRRPSAASSSPLTNDVPSVQKTPDPTSAGIWSEPSNAAGSAVASVSRKPCSSSDQLAVSALLLPVRKPEWPPPTRGALRLLAGVGVLGRAEVLHHLPHLRGVAERAGLEAADQHRVALVGREVERAHLAGAVAELGAVREAGGEEVGLAVHHALALDQRLGVVAERRRGDRPAGRRTPRPPWSTSRPARRPR